MAKRTKRAKGSKVDHVPPLQGKPDDAQDSVQRRLERYARDLGLVRPRRSKLLRRF